MQTQAPEMVSHLTLAHGAGIEAQKLSESLFQFFLLESRGKNAQYQQCLQESLDCFVTETQRRSPLASESDNDAIIGKRPS